jgi:hypothetical protein
MASRGQPSPVDLWSSRLCPKLRRHPTLLLRPGASRPDPWPAPQPLFSSAKLTPPWRAIAGESLSSLKPKISSPRLPLVLATVRPHLIDGRRRIGRPPTPVPPWSVPPLFRQVGCKPMGNRPSYLGLAGNSPCEQWDFPFSTGFILIISNRVQTFRNL